LLERQSDISDVKGSEVMFFKKRKKDNKAITAHSPLNGEVIELDNVPDPVFSQKMMGEGIGFIPKNGEVFSPVNGKITQIFPTQHAIGMLTEEGVELLIHLGLETVELKGEGFHIEVNVGDELQINDRIGTFDLEFIEEKGKKTISVLVFPNMEEKLDINVLKTGEVNAGTGILELRLK